MQIINSCFEFFQHAEEEMKRLKASIGYGQVAFSYDDQSSATNQTIEANDENNETKDDPEDEAYVPHRKFYIPPNMELVSGLNNC